MRSESRRLGYLHRLGIPVWRHRLGSSSRSEDSPEPSSAKVDACQALDALSLEVSRCVLCKLHQGRTNTVFGVGSATANCMVIGEGPGAEEDRTGEPFVGRAGRLLNAMLAAIGLPRESVYIANMVKCRPPRNRDPEAAEVASCRSYLQQQIAIVQPRLIVAVGRVAAQRLLQSDAPLGRMRGRVHRLAPEDIPVVVTYHPAYLLRSPDQKPKAWEDLKTVKRMLDGFR